MTIRKLPGKNQFRVTARTGRNFGTYPTKAQAEVRLAQIERFSRFKQWKSKK